MNELSLFTGAGGGILGTHGLLGWKCLGYVEFNDYCQRVLRQRIADGLISEAPIFGDITTFVSEYARSYRGMVDVVSGGFPCQPFSIAGKRASESDERNMWPATLAVIRAVRPRFAFLENVTGLLSVDDGRYFGRILGDLASCGYDARWRVLSAAELGAPHKRDRLWIVADTGREHGQQGNPAGMEADEDERTPRDVHDQSGRARWWDTDPADGATQPVVGRVAHGVAYRVDRLKAIGNGQVPAVAAAAWNLLTEDLNV